MVAGPSGRSRLVKVVAMAPGFPFHGSFNLNLKGKVTEFDDLLLHQKPIAWIYPGAQPAQPRPGGSDYFGEEQISYFDIVKEDAGLQFQPAEFAPKVFISHNFIEETALLQEGNTAFRNQLYQLPEGINAQSVAEKIGKSINSPDIRVYSHQRAGHRAGRLLRYLSDFLALVSLVALFLACLGKWLFIPWIPHPKIKDLAILISLGASPDSPCLLMFSRYPSSECWLSFLRCLPALSLCLSLKTYSKNSFPFQVDAGSPFQALYLPSGSRSFQVFFF